MKYIKQFAIILTITVIGEGLRTLLPLPIPATVYGLILMLSALKLNLVKLDQVKEVGEFLIEIMPLMFIPATVGLMDSWGSLKQIFIPVVIITILSTIVVMVVTGKTTQFILHLEGKRNKCMK